MKIIEKVLAFCYRLLIYYFMQISFAMTQLQDNFDNDPFKNEGKPLIRDD